METSELIELGYLEPMSEKAEELLQELIVGKSYSVSPDAPFPAELMESVAKIVIDVAVVNTQIRAFHVSPLYEGHLYMLQVQDKKQQTVADVMMTTTKAKSTLTIDSVIVAFKAGAVIARHEELEEQSAVFVGEMEEAEEAQG